MAKPTSRPHSRYALEAAELLGLMINEARISRGLTISELAERAGLSRGLVHRVEKGEMGCSIGAAFELGAIVGIPLFDLETVSLTRHLAAARDRQALLPRRVRHRTMAVKDDF